MPSRLLKFQVFVLLLCFARTVAAQVISGTLERPLKADRITLHGTQGSDHHPMDSVSIDADGYFIFPQRTYPPGFYQLSVNDSDRVDIILDPLEPEVHVAFHGYPLQRNVEVLRSGENQRLWTYKLISRTGQEKLAAVRLERSRAEPLDTASLRSLYNREMAASAAMKYGLDSLVAIAPHGQFAFAVAADRRLEAAIPDGQRAILHALDLSEPRNLRSAAFAKAIMAHLQSASQTDEYALHRSCDTLLHAAAGDSACWAYTRTFLVDLFATYGPDELAQYLVDRYVVGTDARIPPDGALLRTAAEQLRLIPGAPAPEIELRTPGMKRVVRLSSLFSRQTYTALFFYSSTCDHCHDQMPGLRQLVAEMEPSFFKLIGIALDADSAEFRTTLAEMGINWSCYTDLKGWGTHGAKDYAVKATPMLIVIDREGRIAFKPRNHEELRVFLETKKPR